METRSVNWVGGFVVENVDMLTLGRVGRGGSVSHHRGYQMNPSLINPSFANDASSIHPRSLLLLLPMAYLGRIKEKEFNNGSATAFKVAPQSTGRCPSRTTNLACLPYSAPVNWLPWLHSNNVYRVNPNDR